MHRLFRLQVLNSLCRKISLEAHLHGASVGRKENSPHIRKFRREQLQSRIWLTVFSYMSKNLLISSYFRKPFLIYDFANAPLWISLYNEENFFFFISMWATEIVYHGWLLISLTPLPKTMVRTFSKQLWPKKLWSASMAGICGLHLFPALATLVRNWLNIRIEITLH